MAQQDKHTRTATIEIRLLDKPAGSYSTDTMGEASLVIPLPAKQSAVAEAIKKMLSGLLDQVALFYGDVPSEDVSVAKTAKQAVAKTAKQAVATDSDIPF